MGKTDYLDSAKLWWTNASPSNRQNAITGAVPVILYFTCLAAPYRVIIDARHGMVTPTTIVLPVAILAACIICLRVWGHRWRTISKNAQAAIGVGAFVIGAYCTHGIACGLFGSIRASKLFLIVEIALLLVMFAINARYIFDLWRKGIEKERVLSGVAGAILMCFFVVLLSPGFSSLKGLLTHDLEATSPASPDARHAQDGKPQGAHTGPSSSAERRPADEIAYDAEGVPYPTIQSADFDVHSCIGMDLVTYPVSEVRQHECNQQNNYEFASVVKPAEIDAINNPQGDILWGKGNGRRAYSCKSADLSALSIAELYYFANALLKKYNVWVDRESCIIVANITNAGSVAINNGTSVVFTNLAEGNCYYNSACKVDVEVALGDVNEEQTKETYRQYYIGKVFTESGSRRNITNIFMKMCIDSETNKLRPCEYTTM
jgi:hypothetical protein